MRVRFIEEFHEKLYMMKVRESKRLLEFIKANSKKIFDKGDIEAREFYDSYNDIIFNSQSLKFDSFFIHNLELIAKALRLNNDKNLLLNIRSLDRVRCEYAYTPDSLPGPGYLSRYTNYLFCYAGPGYLSRYANYLFCYAYYYNLSSTTFMSLLDYFYDNFDQIYDWADLNGVVKPFSPLANNQIKLIDEDCYFEVTKHLIDEVKKIDKGVEIK